MQMDWIHGDFAASRAVELQPYICFGFILGTEMNSHIAVPIGVEPHGVGRAGYTFGMQVAGCVGLSLQNNGGLDLGWDGVSPFPERFQERRDSAPRRQLRGCTWRSQLGSIWISWLRLRLD